MVEVFSSGGGKDSACVTALIIQGRLPKPDFAVIVDTGREHPAVWEYQDAVIVPELAKIGVTMHRVPKDDYTTVDLWSENDKHLMIPAFTNINGSVGKFQNFCSSKWKQRIRQRYLRKEHGIPTKEQRAWIGFTIDEVRRIVRIESGQDAHLIRLPLVRDIPLNRQQAISVVKRMGWPDPPRSACWMCPNHGHDEWVDLKENWPDEFQKAVELEREIQLKDPSAFLHVSCVPLDEVDFSQYKNPTSTCDSGMCFV